MERSCLVKETIPKVVKYLSSFRIVKTVDIQKYFRIGYGILIDIMDELERLNLIKHIEGNKYKVLFKYRIGCKKVNNL